MYIFIWWGFVALSSQSCFFRCWWLLYWKSVTWWVKFFFFFLRWEQTEPSLFKPIVEWSGERTEKKRREVRHGIPTQNTQLHSTVTHVSISFDQKSGVTLGISNQSPPLSPCDSLRVCFSSEEPIPPPNYNTTQPVNRVSVYEKRSHSRQCPVADSLCRRPQPQKNTSSLRTNCASPHFLMTSFSTTAPFVVFLKNYMAKKHVFPEKRPLPTAGCRVFAMCVSPPPRPRVYHPSALPLKPDMSYLSVNEADGIMMVMMMHSSTKGRTH